MIGVFNSGPQNLFKSSVRILKGLSFKCWVKQFVNSVSKNMVFECFLLKYFKSWFIIRLLTNCFI